MMKRIDGRNADTLREIKIIRSPQKDPQGSVLVEWVALPALDWRSF